MFYAVSTSQNHPCHLPVVIALHQFCIQIECAKLDLSNNNLQLFVYEMCLLSGDVGKQCQVSCLRVFVR